MSALVLEVVELMAKHTAARLTGLFEMIRDRQTGDRQTLNQGVRGERYTRNHRLA
jgi:hypothetical protein